MKQLLLISLTLLISACGFEQVDTGYRGIKTRFGEVIGEPLSEGLHFYNPITSSVREYSVREEKLEGKTEIFTKDTQQVDVAFTLVYYADPKQVTTLFREFGREADLESKIIIPVALGSIKDSIGQVIADELVMKREAVTKAALSEVRANLAARNVIVTDLQFTNLDFDNGYEQAVSAKVAAYQHAQTAKNESVRIQEEAKQTIMTAQAAAESMRIKSEALAKNKGLVQYEIAQKWNGVLPVTMIGGNGAVPFLDIQKIGKND